jgi:hypothetical protein
MILVLLLLIIMKPLHSILCQTIFASIKKMYKDKTEYKIYVLLHYLSSVDIERHFKRSMVKLNI